MDSAFWATTVLPTPEAWNQENKKQNEYKVDYGLSCDEKERVL